MVLSLVASLILPLARANRAQADQGSGPEQAKAAALAAKVSADASRIHQLTEQLDQARLQVNSTSAQLVGVMHQHDATVQLINAERAVLLEAAVRAYMQGGVTGEYSTSTAAQDAVFGTEYLRVASGDAASTGDQLKQLDADLQADLATLRSAQQANTSAMAQLNSLRNNAIAIATQDQAELEATQAQLAAQQARLISTSPAIASSVGATQGGPVNDGLITVVKQAVAQPVASAPAPTTTVAPKAGSSTTTASGGNAGGVWLSLRQCESSDDYTENSGNGFYGAYQFSQATWTGMGYPGRPDLEPPAMQDDAAMKLQAQSGWGQWPACAAALGLA